MKNFLKLTLILVISVIFAAGCASGTGANAPSLPAKPADFFQRGVAALNAGDFDGAIADFKSAVDLNQYITHAFFGLAYSYAFKDEGWMTTDFLYEAIASLSVFMDAVDRRVYIDFRDDYYIVQADFEKRLTIDLSGIREDIEMSGHFAMQNASWGLFANEARDEEEW